MSQDSNSPDTPVDSGDNQDINVQPNVQGGQQDFDTGVSEGDQAAKDKQAIEKYEQHLAGQESEGDSDTQGDDSDSGDNQGDTADEGKQTDEGDDSNPEDDESLQPFFKEFAENGELSEESYNQLKERGIPRKMVDEYIQTRQSVSQAITQAGYQAVGGEDQFKSIAEWAKSNVPEAELQEYNQAVSSGDINKALEAVSNLKSKYEGAVGQEPKLVGQTSSPSTTTQSGYQSMAQLTEAMRDPRYKTDPAYRAEVQAKLQRSKLK